MKRILSVLLLMVAMSLPCLAQNYPDAPQPKAEVLNPKIDNVLVPYQTIPVPVVKEHNFFWNGLNTPTFVAQAGGAFWMAREENGNASNFTTPSFWHRYLPNAYRESFGIMVAGDAVAYGFHKAHFKNHHKVERAVMWTTAGALYITADRYLKAYNKADCVGGLQQFCH